MILHLVAGILPGFIIHLSCTVPSTSTLENEAVPLKQNGIPARVDDTAIMYTRDQEIWRK